MGLTECLTQTRVGCASRVLHASWLDDHDLGNLEVCSMPDRTCLRGGLVRSALSLCCPQALMPVLLCPSACPVPTCFCLGLPGSRPESLRGAAACFMKFVG